MFKARKNRPERSRSRNGPILRAKSRRWPSVSLRQLQWWDERKVVSPRHEGHRRVYFPAEVIEITVIAELRRKGFSLQKIRRVLRFLQREMGKRLAEVMQRVLGSAPGHRRQIDLPRRSARPHHRHPQERPPADVPGVRQRPGPPAGRHRAQARPHGTRRGRPPSAHRLSGSHSVPDQNSNRRTHLQWTERSAQPCRSKSVNHDSQPSEAHILKISWRLLIDAVSSPSLIYSFPLSYRACVLVCARPDSVIFGADRGRSTAARHVSDPRTPVDQSSRRSPRFTTRWSRISPIPSSRTRPSTTARSRACCARSIRTPISSIPRNTSDLREDQSGHYYGIGMMVQQRNDKTIVVAPVRRIARL